MSRYCYNCSQELRLTDTHCPYCSARQSSPSNPLFGFLIYEVMQDPEIFLAAILVGILFLLFIVFFIVVIF